MSRLFTVFALLFSIALPVKGADPLQKYQPQAPVHLQHPEWSKHAVIYQINTRQFTPEPRTYTYWDYTQLRFPKKEGMRIDFVLASQALAARVTGASIDREERKGKGASDHAPVLVELAD